MTSTVQVERYLPTVTFSKPVYVGRRRNGARELLVSARTSNSIFEFDANGGARHTLAGGPRGFADGRGAEARFESPAGIACDDDGIVFVANQKNHRIRKIDREGNVTTLAGSGNAAFANGRGTAAHFHSPLGVAVDGDGNVFVADTNNHRIRKIDREGNVTTLAGSGYTAFANGRGTAAHFHNPQGVAVDGDGNVFVADQKNHRIRKIDREGNVTTLAGSGSATFADGRGTAAHFHNPVGIVVDGDGSVFVADLDNHRIRKIDREGNVTTLAGSGQPGAIHGPSGTATFDRPCSIALLDDGSLVVGDHSGELRRITTSLTFPTASVPRLPSTHAADALRMLEDAPYADVEFEVDGQRIRAHRALLASRCEYFRLMFASHFAEGSGTCQAQTPARPPPSAEESDQMLLVKIGDTTPSAFRALLRYVYTDELLFADEILIDVMRKSRELGLERVFNHALHRSHKCIGVHNAIAWLVQADRHKLEELRDATLRYAARNWRQIRADQQSVTQLSEDPSLMLEILQHPSLCS